MPKIILSLVILGMGLIMCLTSAFASNGLMEEYTHNYLALREADVDSIIKLLESPDSTVRCESVTLIAVAFYKGFPSAQSAVPILIDLLNNDECISVRTNAAGALSRSGDKNGIESLSDLLKDESLPPRLLASVLRGLRISVVRTTQVMRIASENLRSSHPGLRNESLMILAGSQDKGDMKRLLQEYVHFHENPDTLLKAIRSYGLTPLYKNRYDELSYLLSGNLVIIARQAPEILEPLLSHSNPRFKLDAARAFGSERDQRAIPVLLDILKSGKDWAHRSRAAEILGFYRKRHLGTSEEAVIFALKEALNDEHLEQGKGGTYRPVVCQAYQTLLMLGVHTEEPEDLKYVPRSLP